MKAGIVTFPGSNCDDDCFYTLRDTCGWGVEWLWHKETSDLSRFDLVLLPGGFSYGDYLRCGAMASVSPIMEKVIEFAGRGGLTMGICNGFQILCEAGLLPGALALNSHQKFSCKDVALKVITNDTPWTCHLEAGTLLTFPIAHGEGRYTAEESALSKLRENNQVLLTYTDSNGVESIAANPNGSVKNIAGICNEKRNVFGLMPHPERASDLRSGDGLGIWKSIIKTVENARH